MLHKNNKKILLVEDEKNLAFNLELNLSAEGFEVVMADNGESALQCYHRQGPFAAIILDVMLPELNGFEVAQDIRKHDSQTGILMLTARAGDEDRLKGLALGADDYLTKPFHLQELLLRVKRMVDRSELFFASSPEQSKGKAELYRFGPFSLDVDALTLQRPQGPVEVTSLEAEIIKEFMLNPQKTLTRKYLLRKVWGLPGNIETRTVDNFILRIRKLLEQEPNQPRYLLSIRGKGYRLSEPGE